MVGAGVSLGGGAGGEESRFRFFSVTSSSIAADAEVAGSCRI